MHLKESISVIEFFVFSGCKLLSIHSNFASIHCVNSLNLEWKLIYLTASNTSKMHLNHGLCIIHHCDWCVISLLEVVWMKKNLDGQISSQDTDTEWKKWLRISYISSHQLISAAGWGQLCHFYLGCMYVFGNSFSVTCNLRKHSSPYNNILIAHNKSQHRHNMLPTVNNKIFM